MWDAVIENVLGPDVPHMLADIHHYAEDIWVPSGWSCLPSERSKPTGCHGNDIILIKPCDE